MYLNEEDFQTKIQQDIFIYQISVSPKYDNQWGINSFIFEKIYQRRTITVCL